MWDDQASDLVGQLAIKHLDPGKSDPSLIDKIPRGTLNTPEEEARNLSTPMAYRAHVSRLLDVAGDIQEDADGLNYWVNEDRLPPHQTLADPDWQGIRKDVGIFSDEEFEFIMSKCLRSLSKYSYIPDDFTDPLDVPVGGSMASSNAMSLTISDTRVSKKIVEAKKPVDRVQSLAEAIIYSISHDAPPAPTESQSATPGNLTPRNPAVTRLQNGVKRSASGDSLAAAGQKGDEDRKYLGGSKALDHLSKLLTSCETVGLTARRVLTVVLPSQ
jgi:proteasome activator subunit 4